MRTLPLHDILSANGASFTERYGVQVPSVITDKDAEYRLVRDGVGITDFSFMQKFRVPADSGVDALDNIFPGNVAKIRFCRVLHTFLADEEGKLIADCYIANNDEDYIILCESIVDDASLKQLLDKNGAQEAGLEDLTESHVVISIDGYRAWEVARDVFGADVLGLPYLSIETYPFEGTDVSLFRCGKTSEFGYMVMAPKESGEALMKTLLELARKYDGGLCGVEVHDDLRLEGRFFNIFAEGERVGDPLKLGLQWMMDLDKEAFIGREPLLKARENGLDRKIVGLKTEGADMRLSPGMKLFSGDDQVAVVEAACFSQVLDSWVGLALFPADMACAGLDFEMNGPGGAKVRTISMPPIVPKSLSVKLDEM